VTLPYALRDPFRAAHFASAEYKGLWPNAPKYLETLERGGEQGLLDLSVIETFAYEEAMTRAVTSALAGGDPKAALDQAAEDWDALTAAFNLPYVIWMMRGYVQDVPIELEEAALVDGCTRWQALVRIVFPVLRAGFFATAVFTFIFACNEFIFALLLTRTNVLTYPVLVSYYFGAQQTQWARVAAISLVGALPVFLMVATAQRYLVRGISLGAVKG
jgi:ABC-type spermidine/putrescine transport system permease subunit II